MSGTTADPLVTHPSASALAPRRGGWFAMIIIGSLLTLIAASQLALAAALATVVAVGVDDEFVMAPSARVSADASAVTTAPFRIESDVAPATFPDVRVALTAGREGDGPLFIGIGPSSAVSDYLDGVEVAEVRGLTDRPLELQTRVEPGGGPASPPGEQTFWAASESGAGEITATWLVAPGDWTVVLMNADGSSGIDTTVRLGVEAPWAAPVAAALVGVSIALLLVGIALIIVGVAGWGRGRPLTGSIDGVYPVAVTGVLLAPPSRWLWLVKWLLLFPHWIVLSLLWVAFGVTTVAAGFAILFTGRYPRSLFAFTVGMLRWSWRVAFYSYSALGSDRYPPFTLEHADYPADLDVAYPERLTNGLVLVKSWLLAIPHLIVVGVLVGGTTWTLGSVVDSRFWSTGTASTSLLGILVLVAAIILLFTGRYAQPLFDLIIGINRWALRVAAYVALMRDEYPPFRLDHGPTEPAVAVPPSARDDSEI